LLEVSVLHSDQPFHERAERT